MANALGGIEVGSIRLKIKAFFYKVDKSMFLPLTSKFNLKFSSYNNFEVNILL